MKKKVFGIIPIMALLLLVVMMPAGIKAQEVSEDDKANAESYVEYWSTFDYSQELEAVKQQEQMIEKFKEWGALQENAGGFVGITDSSYENKDGIVYADITAEFQKGQLNFKFSFDQDTKQFVDQVTVGTGADQESMGSRMKTAGLNTAMGIIIVFLVLIFMSFVIWLFGFIPVLQKKFSKQPEETGTPAAAERVMEAIAEKEEENLADDLELTAVVTAAIMASMGAEAPADGLVVRSIKRRNTKKWKNA